MDITGEGIAEAALLSDGSAWENLVEAEETLSRNYKEELDEAGFDDWSFCVNVLNDKNKDNTLLSCMNGVTVYNCMEK